MARSNRRAATKPGPKPPIQAVTMMARKKMGVSSPLGRSRNTRISAAATLKIAKPYLMAADGRCAEVSEYDIPQTRLNNSTRLTAEYMNGTSQGQRQTHGRFPGSCGFVDLLYLLVQVRWDHADGCGNPPVSCRLCEWSMAHSISEAPRSVEVGHCDRQRSVTDLRTDRAARRRARR